MVTTTITVKFHNPSLSRRKEWQQAARLYRDTKQFCIDGWENDDFDKSVTTASIDNDLYSAIQNQAIREAKGDHQKDGDVQYRQSQPFALNNQNWELDTTENGSVVVGFPCISGWWYTPVEVYDDVDDAVCRILSDEADKTRLQVYRRGDKWFCTFNIGYDTDPDGETAIGVDVGYNNLLAAHAENADESMLMSGREAKYIRRRFRSLRESLSEAGALRALNRADDKESRRIRELNHTASRRLIDWIEQFETPVLRLEDLEGVRDGSDWRGVHSWHFHQLQEFIVYKAERAGIRVEKVDPEDTSQRCSICGEYGTRDGDRFSCPSCGRERHSDLNGAENIAQRKGEPCTA
ncbi:transposase [Halobacteriales archaeon SW_5_70_135]|nr:MAG: transposase [Halobacteriales archaeon SW_5_70_135]